MFRRLEQLFVGHGAKRMYLNARASGEPFWKAMGFTPTDEIQPHNITVIWEKEVAMFNVLKMQTEQIEFVVDILTSGKNKAALHLSDRSHLEWHNVFVNYL